MLLDGEKKLGFGFLRLPHIDPDDSSDVDLDTVREMVDHFMASGFKYFDTAYVYLKQKSELFLKEALTSRYPRESFMLTTKLPSLVLKEDSDIEAIFEEQLEKCGVEYFDYYFLHGLNERAYNMAEKAGCFEFLQRVKADGRAKGIGFSFHDSPELLDKILTRHPEVDVVQIQLNYLDWENPIIQSKGCYEVCVKHGKPVIVMEPVKGGTLAKVPQEALKLMEECRPGSTPAEWAVRFAASQPNVAMVLSGMSNMEQIKENTSFMSDFKPLTDSEIAMLRKCAEIIRSSVAIPCTGCSYCTDGCPMGIPIPRYFSLYNEDKRDGWQVEAGKRYKELTEKHSPASQCLKCGQCEAKCPQKIGIIGWLEKVSERFEK